jgi:hypothetical protein
MPGTAAGGRPLESLQQVQAGPCEGRPARVCLAQATMTASTDQIGGRLSQIFSHVTPSSAEA